MGVIEIILSLAIIIIAVKGRSSYDDNYKRGIKLLPALSFALFAAVYGQYLLAFAFFFCMVGDYFIDLEELTFGGFFFIVAHTMFCILFSRYKNYSSVLSLANLLAIFYILRLIKAKTYSVKFVEIIYSIVLATMAFYAVRVNIYTHLGASLFVLSDLTLLLKLHMDDAPTTTWDSFGTYCLGLFFILYGILI